MLVIVFYYDAKIQKISDNTKRSDKANNICISNRSKLRAERTKKSLARNSRVLSDFS